MNNKHIIIIEDEADIQELIKYTLSKEGYKVTGFTSGEEGLKSVKQLKPDLILLDLMLPGMDGLEICRQLKKESTTDHIPIIMLTAKTEESDIVSGLEMGADDYITKPFSPKVLIARIRSLFRRLKSKEITEQSVIELDDIIINPGKFEVLVNSKPIVLTLTEFQILHQLAKKPGWVFTRDQLIDSIRGEDVIITDRSIDVQIVGLRKKLGKLGHQIETVRGIGYRFKE
ncbi:MAG: DNA-binding response regulator [Candidatus Zixiibacteriota bacterium]|nr:MAG: DNA-binding response regulator [candidate division Zixibacteria bacterium]